MILTKKLRISLAMFFLSVACVSSYGGVHTQIIDAGDDVYVKRTVTDQSGNSFSTVQKMSKQDYLIQVQQAEAYRQRQEYLRWYYSLPYVQRAAVDAQNQINGYSQLMMGR